jgi:Integral membrane protein S linking to the trans Golgi network
MKGKSIIHFNPVHIISQIIANQLIFYICLSVVYFFATLILGWHPQCHSYAELLAASKKLQDIHPISLHAQFLNHTEPSDLSHSMPGFNFTEYHDAFWTSHPFFNTTLVNSHEFTLKDFLWNHHCMHLDNLNGFAYLLLYLSVILVMAHVFGRIVRRTKSCLDFALTLFLFHALFTSIFMTAFPSDFIWWSMLSVFVTLLTLYAEVLCSRSELEPISLSNRANNFVQNLKEINFKGAHINLPWSSKFSFKLFQRPKALFQASLTRMPIFLSVFFKILAISAITIFSVLIEPFIWILVRLRCIEQQKEKNLENIV